MRLKINNEKTGITKSVSHLCGDGVALIHQSKYEEHDVVIMEVGEAYGLYWIRLDEALEETLVYVDKLPHGGILKMPIPTEDQRVCYTPKAFSGSCHVLTARKASKEDEMTRRNLAVNPYDCHNAKGFYPHATANVETRNEAVFAARNAIDGIHVSEGHGVYPYSSWGINQDPKAAITIDFGRNVEIDGVRITLRADFPHDNWWTSGDIQFSDGTEMTLNFVKSALPQEFTFEKKVVNRIVFTNLIKSKEASPFPALTQIEVYGIPVEVY